MYFFSVVVVILSTGILLCGIAQDIIQYEVGRMVTGTFKYLLFYLSIWEIVRLVFATIGEGGDHHIECLL